MISAQLVYIPAERVGPLFDSPQEVREAIDADMQDPYLFLNLEEAWHGIHFVLTGELPIPREEAIRRGLQWDEDSLENVLLGGTVIPFGSPLLPARCLRPLEVSVLADRLCAVGIDGFRERFDPDALEEEAIPPLGWSDDPTRLVSTFTELVRFYQDAAAHGDGLLIVYV